MAISAAEFPQDQESRDNDIKILRNSEQNIQRPKTTYTRNSKRAKNVRRSLVNQRAMTALKSLDKPSDMGITNHDLACVASSKNMAEMESSQKKKMKMMKSGSISPSLRSPS